eukprot:CAMPEP_0194483586 /NCGR_PEP_ID=MMETSP0253-20130528/5138_1 /TAXON_ID=2966 /ORGANISM="Noctiluca scintillans" /LENGTH=60 /DNA_ID=CAMNT_0039323257 /DNA_START=68 /DNA_END=250 /DNA_ORIENTATION=-
MPEVSCCVTPGLILGCFALGTCVGTFKPDPFKNGFDSCFAKLYALYYKLVLVHADPPKVE